MSPSTTSSSDPDTPRGRPQHKVLSTESLRVSLRPAVALLLAMAFAFVLIEVAFRIWNPIPFYDGWENPDLYKKMDGARRTYEEHGRIDVLLLATSIGRPIDVNRWEDATGNKVICYNGAYPDSRPQSQSFLFEKYYWPRFQPKHLVYCVAPSDLNSSARGMNPNFPRAEPFWRYHNIRAFDPANFPERVRLFLDKFSAVFRTRHRIRARLELGPQPPEFITPSIDSGVIVPSTRRNPTGPPLEPWSRKPGWLKQNPYHDYWLPNNGELGQLRRLVNFCKDKGVKLTFVEVPNAPLTEYEFDNAKADMQLFDHGLDRIESWGVPVVRSRKALNLNDNYFEDSTHLNRWGAEIMTNFIWENIIRPWFPEKAKVETLLPSQQIGLFKTVEPGDGIRFAQLPPVGNQGGAYESLQQVIIEKQETVVPVEQVGPGRYVVELYGGDGTTTSPELTGAVKVTLQAVDPDGTIANSLLLDKWAHIFHGISYTQGIINVPTTATLQFHTQSPPGTSLIFDVAFLRRMISKGPDEVTVVERLPDDD